METLARRWRLTLLRKQGGDQRGFSLLELLIALTVLLIGITGILTMQIISMRATSYSRHATEAAVLAEDKLEQLRTVPISNPAFYDGDENVNAQGITTGDATQDYFRREWKTAWDPVTGIGTVRITIWWWERGKEPHQITMRTQRTAN